MKPLYSLNDSYIYNIFSSRERLDEDRWNRFFVCICVCVCVVPLSLFASHIYFFRSFVGSLKWRSRLGCAKRVKCWNCTLFVLLMPQIVNHKKARSRGTTHKHIPTHLIPRTRYSMKSTFKFKRTPGSTILGWFRSTLGYSLTFFSHCFFFVFNPGWDWLRCRAMLPTARKHEQNKRRLSIKFII